MDDDCLPYLPQPPLPLVDWLPVSDVRKGARFGLSPERILQSSVGYLHHQVQTLRKAKQSGSSTDDGTSTQSSDDSHDTMTASQKPSLADLPAAQKHDGAQVMSPRTEGNAAANDAPLSPVIYAEEPPPSLGAAFEKMQAADATKAPAPRNRSRPAFPRSESHRTDDANRALNAKSASTRSMAADPELLATSAAARFNKSHPRDANGQLVGAQDNDTNNAEAAAAERPKRSSMSASLLDTATVLPPGTSEFPSIEELQEQVEELQQDYAARHPQQPLTGRIIHVSHFIPFVIRARAEVEFEKKREQKVAATATVAALAAAARARRAAEAAGQMDASQSQELQAAQRKMSFLEGLCDTTDMDKRLAENQARSRARAGRKAWVMTPMDEDAVDEDEADINDRFTPIGSRRESVWTEASGNDEMPAYSAVSDENSPLRTPALKKVPASPPPPPPEWVLVPRRGHTALNSGIRSLCATHKQTYIGWPGDIQFAAQAKNDERKSASQTTDIEKQQIEFLLASLDSPKNWSAQEVSSGAATGEASTRVPSPRMNGADPVDASQAASAMTPTGGKASPAICSRHGIKYVPVWLEDNVAHGHYEGYCKTTLWPLFHYLLWQDVPGDRREWEDYMWHAYVSANEAYARRIAEQYKPGDLVWIHDYHLLLVPSMLRKLVPEAHIGLFIHAPWPSSEIFRCLPQRREIIEGMLGADLACFQAFSYSRHFLSSCIRVCGFEASSNSVESYQGHITNVSYNPIGIDANRISRDCSLPGVKPKIEAIRNMYKDKLIIIGRDKLDVVRGVVQKLQAFHKLLEEFPQWREKVVLIQVTAPSMNDNPLLERQVSELVAHINGEFGSLSFTPVHHYHQIIERDEYFALLSVADLAIVSSLRDGMTASTMEFIVAQHQTGKAPLLLSEFSGSAGRLRSAIQINPWATFSSAKAIHHALVMSDEEREHRHSELYRQVTLHTSHTWAATLVKVLVQQLLSEQSAHFTPPLERKELVAAHKKSHKSLFLLDYDGTLTPIVRDPAAALPSKRLLEALQKLSEDDNNIIYIISGRDEQFLSKHLGHLQHLGFSAEHGGYVKEPNSKHWVNLTKELDMSWMKDIQDVFEYYVERTAGSTIEVKKSSVTWHYRNADPDYGLFQAKECQALLDNLVAQQGLAIEVLVGKKNLEVRPLAVNKGEIVRRILYNNSDAEFVFCAGDDKTDEDMFRALRLIEASGTGGSSAPTSTAGSPQVEHKNKELGAAAAHALANAAAANPSTSSPLARRESSDGRQNGLQTPSGGGNRDRGDSPARPATALYMSPPAPLSSANTPMGSPKVLALKPAGIFTTTIGPSGKKTLAKWHVDSVERIIDSLAEAAGMSSPEKDKPSDADEAAADNAQDKKNVQAGDAADSPEGAGEQ